MFRDRLGRGYSSPALRSDTPPPRILKDEPHTTVAVHDEGGRLVVEKTYVQPRWLLWRTFLTSSRAAREFRNLKLVHGAGVPCVRPLRWREQRRFGLVLGSTLWTEYVPVPSLRQVLETRPDAQARAALAAGVGELLARLHGAGFLGGRVTPRNLLVAGEARDGRLLLVDLPAAVAFRASIHGSRSAAIDLWDAAFSASRRQEWSRAERWRLLRRYYGEAGAARAAWRRLARRTRLGNRLRKDLLVLCDSYLRAWLRLLTQGRMDALPSPP